MAMSPQAMGKLATPWDVVRPNFAALIAAFDAALIAAFDAASSSIYLLRHNSRGVPFIE
jgi:hypothetical protein